MALLDEVKQELRISYTDAFDTEIENLIDEAQKDLALSGLTTTASTATTNIDSLVTRAVKLYAKANFGLNNVDSDKYTERYEKIKTHLCLNIDRTTETEA